MGLLRHPFVNPNWWIGMSGCASNRAKMSRLILFSGNMALQRYSNAETEPKARCFWFSVMSETSHLSLCPFRLAGFFGNIRYHRREWWAIIFLNIDMASNQLDNSLAEYSPNVFAMAERAGNWGFRFLYILDKVPKEAVSNIIHASGLSPAKVLSSHLSWTLM